MANPNISAAEMKTLLEMVINSPVGSYINALQRQPLVNKLVEAHNGVAAGGRLDVLSPQEAAQVDNLRLKAAKPAPQNKPGKPADLRGGTVVGPQPAKPVS